MDTAGAKHGPNARSLAGDIILTTLETSALRLCYGAFLVSVGPGFSFSRDLVYALVGVGFLSFGLRILVDVFNRTIEHIRLYNRPVRETAGLPAISEGSD